MSRTVELRPAERDLDRLVEFVAKLDERAGDARERGLREKLRKLGVHPSMGRPGPGKMRQFTARFGKSSYLIRYPITDDAVIITRIWHGRENRPR